MNEKKIPENSSENPNEPPSDEELYGRYCRAAKGGANPVLAASYPWAAEDIAHDTAADALRMAPPPNKPTSWCFRTARNRALNWRREKAPEIPLEDKNGKPNFPQEIESPSYSETLDEIERDFSDLVTAFGQAMEKMKLRDKKALLYLGEGKTFHEISQTTGATEKAVRRHAYRAIRKFHVCLIRGLQNEDQKTFWKRQKKTDLKLLRALIHSASVPRFQDFLAQFLGEGARESICLNA